MAKLRKNISEDEFEKIIEMFKEGYGPGTIARILGIKGGPVDRFLKEQGLSRTRQEGLDARLKATGNFGGVATAGRPKRQQTQDRD